MSAPGDLVYAKVLLNGSYQAVRGVYLHQRRQDQRIQTLVAFPPLELHILPIINNMGITFTAVKSSVE